MNSVRVVRDELRDRGRFRDDGGHRNLYERGRGPVDTGPVHVDDVLALLDEALVNGLLDEGDRLGLRQNAGDLEETGLHDRVDPVAEPDLLSDLERVDVVDLDLFPDDRPLHVFGQVLEDLVCLPVGVDQERPALPDALEDVVPADVGGLVQGDEIDVVHQVLGLDRALAEAEVGDRDAPRFLGVVLESSPDSTGRCCRR